VFYPGEFIDELDFGLAPPIKKNWWGFRPNSERADFFHHENKFKILIQILYE